MKGVVAMDIKHLLIPVDFSPPSILAVNYGVALARKFRSRVTLLCVTKGSRGADQVWSALQVLVSPEDQDDLNVEFLVKEGDVETEIATAITESKASAVIMGTHGRHLLGRLLIGSVTQDLLRKTPVPIFTVCHAFRPIEFNSILYATDFSELSQSGFFSLIRFARTLRAKVQIVHVLTPSVFSYANPESTVLLQAERERHRIEATGRLRQLVGIAKNEGVEAETTLIEGNPALGILSVADEKGVDLIALSVEARGFLDRTVFGTTAERVIRESRIPVLSLTAKKTNVETSSIALVI
jgi:nucleotide-binding universal stress UspA family protein